MLPEILVAAAAVGLILWLLLRKKKSPASGASGRSSPSGQGGSSKGAGGQPSMAQSSSGDSQEEDGQQALEQEEIARREAAAQRERDERRRREAHEAEERAIKEAGLEKLDLNDPLMRQVVNTLAGTTHDSLRETDMQRKVGLLAQRLNMDQLATLQLVASQRDVVIDLAKRDRREPVLYPTNDVEPDQMRDMSELPIVLPEQLAMDDESLDMALAQSSLPVLRSYETRTETRLLHIVMDVSYSMKDPMQDGLPRHVWSRAIAINLLRQALAGDAKFMLRFFDGSPFPLNIVRTQDEALRVIDVVFRTGLTEGGTNIWNAVSQAIRDIREDPANRCDILLITDGQDSSISDIVAAKAELGEIKLNVAAIGTESGVLRSIAHNYTHFP